MLAALIRTHRRGIPRSAFELIPDRLLANTRHVAALLRLAVLLHRAHETDEMPVLRLRGEGERLQLVLDERWLRARPLLRADLTVNETYRHVPGPPLPIPLTVLGGIDDPRAEHAELAAWQELSADSALFTFPGGHFYLDDRVPEILEVVRTRMAA